MFTVDDDTPRAPDERLARAINSKLPADVLITHAERVGDAFEPISDCRAKGYRYSMHSGPERPMWSRRRVWWTYEALDAERMQQAATHLVGTHDFASFAAASHGRESTVRTIFGCTVHSSSGEGGGTLIEIDVWGNGFLYNMVGIIAGTLMEVGRGRFTPDDVAAMIDAKDRASAGPTLGPAGLCLQWIEYPDFVCGERPECQIVDHADTQPATIIEEDTGK
jgi:tRNA pseudouridine38-40 synthase